MCAASLDYLAISSRLLPYGVSPHHDLPPNLPTSEAGMRSCLSSYAQRALDTNRYAAHRPQMTQWRRLGPEILQELATTATDEPIRDLSLWCLVDIGERGLVEGLITTGALSQEAIATAHEALACLTRGQNRLGASTVGLHRPQDHVFSHTLPRELWTNKIPVDKFFDNNPAWRDFGNRPIPGFAPLDLARVWCLPSGPKTSDKTNSQWIFGPYPRFSALLECLRGTRRPGELTVIENGTGKRPSVVFASYDAGFQTVSVESNKEDQNGARRSLQDYGIDPTPIRWVRAEDPMEGDIVIWNTVNAPAKGSVPDGMTLWQYWTRQVKLGGWLITNLDGSAIRDGIARNCTGGYHLTPPSEERDRWTLVDQAFFSGFVVPSDWNSHDWGFQYFEIWHRHV